MAESEKRFAVVTGSNKGIGLGICRQLAANGVIVVLTAIDDKEGLEALEGLKQSGLSNLVFHQLDVAHPESIASLACFIKTQFGKLDILVNNAGVAGMIVKDPHAFVSGITAFQGSTAVNWNEIVIESLETAEECLNINYYGPKRMVEALLPLLQLSDSPRIVNLSSSIGKLQDFPNGWAKGVLSDAKKLTEERVSEVLKQFLEDFKEGALEAKGWPTLFSAYRVSKAALNAYTRLLARKCPTTFCINSVCPGFVKTDLNYNSGILTVEEGAESPARLALLPHGGPSGQFFDRKQLSHF